MSIITNLKRVHLRLTDPAVYHYQGKRAVLGSAPFSISHYRARIESFQAMGLSFPPFNDNPNTECANIYVRHDVDTQACIDKISRVIELDRTLGVPSSVYFRVDDEDYKFSEFAEIVQAIAGKDFEVGLHTSCYSYSDSVARFKYETKKFEEESGVKPTSFTLHGLGRQHHASRIRFRNYIGRNLEKFGYEFSDCLRSLRHYRYVIEDCHVLPNTGERFIYDDFKTIPESLTRKGNILLLTHPCYWVS